jgi:hypothetical protein
MYHPKLDVELDWDVPDTAAAVLAESGWKIMEEPDEVPSPLRPPTPAPKPTKSAAKKAT